MGAKPTTARDVERDIGAAKVLKAHLVELLGEEAVDALTIRDAIEGETGLFDTINAAVAQIAEDEAAADALKLYVSRVEARRSRLEKRAEMLRTSLMNALDTAGDGSLKLDAGAIAARITARALAQLGGGKLDATLATVTAKAIAPKLHVVDEAMIPTAFYRSPPPVLDNQELTRALKDRRDRLEDAAKRVAAGEITETERADLVAAWPPIPGAELSNGGMTLQIRLS